MLIAALFTTTANAQNWIVGEPVDMVLTQITMYGSGCTPDVDEALNFPGSIVNGVDYVAIVMQVSPAGTITVTPGPSAALNVGDTIWLTGTVIRDIVFTTGSGSVELEFKAIGTPTTVGQAHPCAGSDMWISDMGICPETLSLFMDNNCATENSTGIIDRQAARPWFIAPSAANGGRMEVYGAIAESIRVLDLQGREVNAPVSTGEGWSMDMGAAPAGIYMVHATALNGELLTRSFPVVH